MRRLLGRIHDQLYIKPGETSADGKVSLLNARCLGACSMAPAVMVDGNVQGRVTIISALSSTITAAYCAPVAYEYATR
ncbi:MAG: NAD(P)H-dependent oxidoreductase subunit E [Acidimicrobiales bacterium]